MVFRAFILLSLFSTGCTFDSSTAVVGGIAPDAAKLPGCDGFVPEPCDPCGVQVCTETPAGLVIDCVVDPLCDPLSPATECQDGEVRPCGDCADQLCIGGQWLGDCAPRHERCQAGSYCLDDSGGGYQCEASCSTAGFGGSCPGSGGPQVPAYVPVGTEWKLDGSCDDDFCVDCICTSDFSSVPYVECFYACD